MPNRLSDSSSPYLRQHADNPVDWHPWDEVALGLARSTDRPILLSIGYAACHWCHVMAHESFEDEATAEVMNRLFVNIKVDREERPDLDKLYQTAQMLLTRRGGGWPLTMFLSAGDQVPFFGGTYFPPEPRHGLPSFVQVLERAAQWYRDNPEEREKQNETVRSALQGIYARTEDAEWPADLSGRVVVGLEQQFDSRHGGFGDAPKFARPTQLRWLLHRGEAHGRPMVIQTLLRMAEGGVQDHVGGGFYRYSVDAQWMVPHFEKMLYDQALLLPLYAQAVRHAEDRAQAVFGDAARGIVDFVLGEMQDPCGGFYSSVDADTAGEEGKTYLWTPDEVRALLPEDRYEAFAFRYGLDRSANFEGRWHLHAFRSLDETAAHTGRAAPDLAEELAASLAVLSEARDLRERPGLDDKMLTSWNALMITGLARAGDLLGESQWRDAAHLAFAHLREHLWKKGRLHASYSMGEASLNGYLDDYAFVLEAGLCMLEGRWDARDAAFVSWVADAIPEKFTDGEGGLYFTSDDHEELLARPRLYADDVTPSGCAVACEALSRAGFLFGRTDWTEQAERILHGTRGAVVRSPGEHMRFLEAREAIENPAPQVVLRGPADEVARWRQEVAGRAECYAVPLGAESLPESLESKPAAEEPSAYVCTGPVCAEPIRSLEAFQAWLAQA